LSEFASHLKKRAVDFGASRAEDGQFLSVLPALEEHEGFEQLIDRGDGHAQVVGVGVGFGDHHHAGQEIAEEVATLGRHGRIFGQVVKE
jgi:hypothetical protein